jgi:hypothetical protein
MGASRGQVHLQEGKARQDGFDKRRTLGLDLWLHRSMHSMEQFASRNHGQKKLFLLPLRDVRLQLKSSPLGLNQDTGIN